jgi:hypothetical protein
MSARRIKGLLYVEAGEYIDGDDQPWPRRILVGFEGSKGSHTIMPELLTATEADMMIGLMEYGHVNDNLEEELKLVIYIARHEKDHWLAGNEPFLQSPILP